MELIKNIINWISENKEWVFSGIGIPVLGYIFFKKKQTTAQNQNITKNIQKQKGGWFSKNTQIGTQNNYRGEQDE